MFAVKDTTDTTSDTIAYSFLDMLKLGNTYTEKAGDSAKNLKISGYEIEFKILAAEDNTIKVKDDDLHVDIFGKTDVVQKSDIAPSAEVTEMLNEVFGTKA